jgi:hypothetical protein
MNDGATNRLPESVQTLFSELLEQHLLASAENAAAGLPPPGAFVSKTIRDTRYWYLQRAEGGQRQQVYLGPESPSLERWMAGVREARRLGAPDEQRRRELVAMVATGGGVRPDGATGRLLQILAERGLFRLGGVLIGTHAFATYGNLLGRAFLGRALRTADVDILHDPALAVALDPAAPAQDLGVALREAHPDFLAVPPLDPNQPSTSFKVRGRDLRVDFLAPARARSAGVVTIPKLGIAAHALPFLGFLLGNVAQTVVLYDQGVLVTVPDPARFALHKIWVAEQRPATEQPRARKDRLQAAILLRILLEDRTGDLELAWQAMPVRARSLVAKAIRLHAELPDLPRELRSR